MSDDDKEVLQSMMIGGTPSDSAMDPRFQNTNITRQCYTHYVDYHRCRRLLGEDAAGCDLFKHTYQRMCPNAWIDKWDNQRRKGIFPRDCKTELD